MCQSNVGTLISIHSAEENKFAIDLANRERTSYDNGYPDVRSNQIDQKQKDRKGQ